MNIDVYYQERKRAAWKLAIMGAVMARRSLVLEEKVLWESLSLRGLHRWVNFVHLIEARKTANVRG